MRPIPPLLLSLAFTVLALVGLSLGWPFPDSSHAARDGTPPGDAGNVVDPYAMALSGKPMNALPAKAGIQETEPSTDHGLRPDGVRPVALGDEGAAHAHDAEARTGTFVATLQTAPFPYHGKYDDTGVDFFDYTDPQTGVRYHTNRYGVRFPEKEHYSDGSVLFHIPPHFKPDHPFAFVVFFHALDTNIRKTEMDYDISGQVDACGKNLILVMPQLAKDAADSSPGRFFRPDTFRAFMDEAAGALAGRLGPEFRQRLRNAPIILAAFSGGYKAAAYVLNRGGASGRIAGVILLDALYEDVDKFEKWALEYMAGSFLVSLATRGECERNSLELAGRLEGNGIGVSREWPVGAISKGKLYVVPTSGAHMQIPVDGPPARPLFSLLRLFEIPVRK